MGGSTDKIVLRAAPSTARAEHRSIANDLAALADWVLEVRERFGAQGKILVCSREALSPIHFMGYNRFEFYPITQTVATGGLGPAEPKTIPSMPV